VSDSAVPVAAAYAAIVMTAVAVPGPDFAVVTRNSVRDGSAYGVATTAGIAAGTLVHVAAAAAGLTALLTTSRTLFFVVQLVGAGYLAYMGWCSLAWLLRRATATEADRGADGATRSAVPLRQAWWQGVLTNLTNPKVLLFYVALMPQFVDRVGRWWWPCLLVGLSVVINAAWFSGIAAAMRWMGGTLRRPRVARRVDAASGAIFLGVGLWLATEALLTLRS